MKLLLSIFTLALGLTSVSKADIGTVIDIIDAVTDNDNDGWDRDSRHSRGRVDRGSSSRVLYVRCESRSDRYNVCEVEGRIEDAYLYQQHSNTTCIEGRNYGITRTSIWVDNGCRATFKVLLRGRDDGPTTSRARVVCESWDRDYQECYVGRGLDRVTLVRQLSDTRCIADITFGMRGDSIWVDHGCRGEFEALLYRRRDRF